MKVTTFRNNAMMLVNELIHANKHSTEDTWAEARDAVLDRFGLKETLGHLEFDPDL